MCKRQYSFEESSLGDHVSTVMVERRYSRWIVGRPEELATSAAVPWS
jgi:hypothetical protein